mgnify:CR=1 FL=1|jgi:hypothetical protein
MQSNEIKKRIRVVIQQPAFPQYRLPFFKLLSEQENIDLKLYFGKVNSVPNIESEELYAEYFPTHSLRIKGRDFFTWHKAQTCFIDKKECDVICFVWNTRFINLVPALIKAKIKGIHTILWGHGYSKRETGVRKFLRDNIAKLATALVFYDYHTAENFIKSGWNEKRIFTAPNSLCQNSIIKARDKWLNIPKKLYDFKKENRFAGRTVAPCSTGLPG